MTEIQSPSGIDLHPDPPATVRISKRAGLVALLTLAIVVGLILLGMYARQRRQTEMSRRAVEEQKPTAAMPAEKELVSEIAPVAAGEHFGTAPASTEFANGASGEARSRGLKVPELKAPLEYRPVGTSGQPNGVREISPEEKLREHAWQREQEAIASPTLIKTADFHTANAAAGEGSPSQNDLLSQLNSFARSEGSQATPGLRDVANALVSGRSATRGVDYEQQNQQDEKEAFLEKASARGSENYLKSTRTVPLGKYEVKAGWDIPAILEQSVNSDLPGEVKALVRSNVYDTATGKYLLIPQGARMVGVYSSRITYGQKGLQVIWTRIIYPDGTSINLEGMVGTDVKGNAGFRYDVDNHYKRLIGFAVLTSLFSAGLEISQRGTTGGTSALTTPTAQETAAAAVGQQLGELGVEVTRRNLNVQPTIKIPIGYRFNIRVNKDMLFDAPYEPLQM